MTKYFSPSLKKLNDSLVLEKKSSGSIVVKPVMLMADQRRVSMDEPVDDHNTEAVNTPELR